MLLRLSWRNIWRQKRRTLITAMSVALALCLSLFTRSLQEGTYSANIDNAARFYTGLIQVQHKDYKESMSIDDLIPASGTLVDALKSEHAITTMLPRIESVVLGAKGEKSKGVLVLGVNPELENEYSGIKNKVRYGDYLISNDRGVLVGEGLARYLELTVGDELVLYGQGYRGQTAAGLYEVKGIIHYPLSDLDGQIVYMPLKLAQELYSTEGNVTAWVLHTDELNRLTEIVDSLETKISQNVNIRRWEDLAPELAQQIAMDKAGGIFLIYVLYGVVGFGLFATIMMMTMERRREFSVMLATGMHRLKIIQLLLLESFYIGFIGVCMGVIFVSPVLIYFYYHPITLTGETAQMMIESGFEPVMPVSLSPNLVLDQIWAVSVLFLLCLLYPLRFIYKLDLVAGLKGARNAN